MKTSLIIDSGWEVVLLAMIFFAIILPALLFIVGLIQLRKNKKRGKTILIIAAIYSLISLGLCGGLGF